jgi:predicted ATP-grasp superfamily ATP-dependent carboligase
MGEADVLVVGASVRALAESAARAGARVAAVDAYGDLDLLACAEAIALRRHRGVEYSAAAAAAVAAGVPARAVAYASNFENFPAALARAVAGRPLLGNPSATLVRVRNPVLLARALARRGLAVPRVRASAPKDRDTGWLQKPRRSGGGHGVARWRPSAPLPAGAYLQELIDGTPGSITFAADGRRAVPLGLSRQIVGDSAFGAAGFRYCGSILAAAGGDLFEHQARLAEAAVVLAGAVTDAFGLVGVNGVDFIARGGVPYAIEVNPRHSASMELVERAHGASIFALHAAACGGALSDPGLYLRNCGALAGKAIVFARDEVTMGQTRRWLRADRRIRDVPHPGERIGAGQPICTVFADGSDAAGCEAALRARAAEIYAAAQSPGRARSVA